MFAERCHSFREINLTEELRTNVRVDAKGHLLTAVAPSLLCVIKKRGEKHFEGANAILLLLSAVAAHNAHWE